MVFAILAIGSIALMSIIDCLFDGPEDRHRDLHSHSAGRVRARWR